MLYLDRSEATGEYFMRTKEKGRIIFGSTETYKRKASALQSVFRLFDTLAKSFDLKMMKHANLNQYTYTDLTGPGVVTMTAKRRVRK